MTRHTRSDTRVYRSRKTRLSYLSCCMLFVSFMLIISGLIGKRSTPADLIITPESTPAPTDVTTAFDETHDERRMTLALKDWYTIQLGVYTSQESADELADSYRDRGAAGFVWPDGDRYRVLASVYDNQEDAQRVRQRLLEQQSIDSYVYTIKPGDLAMEVKGMKGQLDALEACFKQLNASSINLQNLSMKLDMQETDSQAVAKALSEEAHRLRALERLLTERFAPPLHPLISGMKELLNNWAGRTESLASQKLGSSMLAARVKYETLMMIYSAKAYSESLKP